MPQKGSRNAPGQVRDAIVATLLESKGPLSVAAIHRSVVNRMGPVPQSSVRSYLLLNTPAKFRRTGRGLYELDDAISTGVEYPMVKESSPCVAEEALAYKTEEAPAPSELFRYGRTELYREDCFSWLAKQDDCSIHAIVTDPPYGIREYTAEELAKLRAGRDRKSVV